jgi:hypothetical protein
MKMDDTKLVVQQLDSKRTETQAGDDKKRLQELEVDDAFDQLKKDLGL